MILILIFKSLPGVSLINYFTSEHLVLTLLIHTGKQEMFCDYYTDTCNLRVL